jgi:hypothetical protein
MIPDRISHGIASQATFWLGQKQSVTVYPDASIHGQPKLIPSFDVDFGLTLAKPVTLGPCLRYFKSAIFHLGACFAFVGRLDWIAGEAKPTHSVQSDRGRREHRGKERETRREEGGGRREGQKKNPTTAGRSFDKRIFCVL